MIIIYLFSTCPWKFANESNRNWIFPWVWRWNAWLCPVNGLRLFGVIGKPFCLANCDTAFHARCSGRAQIGLVCKWAGAGCSGIQRLPVSFPDEWCTRRVFCPHQLPLCVYYTLACVTWTCVLCFIVLLRGSSPKGLHVLYLNFSLWKISNKKAKSMILCTLSMYSSVSLLKYLFIWRPGGSQLYYEVIFLLPCIDCLVVAPA